MSTRHSRLPELVRSRAFRLALLYAALFGVSITLLLGAIYLLAGNYVESHVDEFVRSELEMFQADFEVDGPSGVFGLVTSRDASDRSNHWLYLYFDADDRRLAGDHRRWPDATPAPDGFLTLPSPTGVGAIRALVAHFPDGSRILVGLNDYEVVEMRRALARAIGVGLGVMLLLAVGGGLLVTVATLRQIEPINRVMREIMVGDLRKRVPVGRNDDEFDVLGANINAMLDRINVLMDAVRGVTDNIAHDLRMPLARLRSRLETALANRHSPDNLQELMVSAIEDVDSILLTFGSLLRIANVESGTLKETFVEVDLGAIVYDAEQIFEPMAAAANRSLSAQVDGEVHVAGNRDLLLQALANLVDNAIKHTPEGARIHIHLRRVGGDVELAVGDDGPGIPAGQRDTVFQRLYRGDESRSTGGNGLGLALVRAVSQLHDGRCFVEDNRPGARVVLRLPSARR